MTIAEGLVLRKHLVMKVAQLEPLKVQGDNGLFELKTERRNINESTDEIKIQAPKVDFKVITAEYNKYSKALRELDTAIQRANWETDLKGFDAKDLEV